MANKLPRIAWAALRKGATFERGYPVAKPEDPFPPNSFAVLTHQAI